MQGPARTNPSGSGLYKIRIRGHLSETLLAAFPGLRASPDGAETVLVGTLPDQAALYGVIGQLETLGLELVEVHLERPGTNSP